MGWTWAAVAFTAAAFAHAGCGDDAPMHASDGGHCPSVTAPQAMPGDPIDGDTYGTFARSFFGSYCVRCHATTRTGAARNHAPEGLNWDDEATVRANLARIRRAVGELNFMPPSPPTPTCAERQRLVRWIDAAAP